MTPLRRRMIEDMQIRNLALNTQETYVEQGRAVRGSSFPPIARTARAARDTRVAVVPGTGQALGGQFDLRCGCRAAVPLKQPTLQCRRPG